LALLFSQISNFKFSMLNSQCCATQERCSVFHFVLLSPQAPLPANQNLCKWPAASSMT
jgi:hypothetical protein